MLIGMYSSVDALLQVWLAAHLPRPDERVNGVGKTGDSQAGGRLLFACVAELGLSVGPAQHLPDWPYGQHSRPRPPPWLVPVLSRHEGT